MVANFIRTCEMCKRRGQLNSGFTLIELLVVIAIIAILAAILFPVFARARQKAHQTNCLANIKQIAMATKMYCTDFNEFGPTNLTGVDEAGNSVNVWWYYGVQGHAGLKLTGYGVASENVWTCSHERYGDPTYSMPNWRTEWQTMWSPDQCTDPTKTMLIGESAYRGYGRYEWMKHPHDMAFAWGPDRFAGVLHPEYTGHQGGNNVAYMDGHAERVEIHKWLTQFNPNDGASGWYIN